MNTRNHYTSHIATSDASLWQQLLEYLAPLFAYFGVEDLTAAPKAGQLSEEQIRQIWERMPEAKRSLISHLGYATDRLNDLYGSMQEGQYRLPAGSSVPDRFVELALALWGKSLTPVRVQALPEPRKCPRTGEPLQALPQTPTWLIETFDGDGQVRHRLLSESQLRRELKALTRWLDRVRFRSKAKVDRPRYILAT
jgi:hypothetical protein